MRRILVLMLVGVVAVTVTAVAPAANASTNALVSVKSNSADGTLTNGTAWNTSTKVRHVTTSPSVNISFAMSNHPDGGMCMRLVNHKTGNLIANTTQCWSANENGVQKTLARTVLNGTEFVTQVRKQSAGGDNYWSGTLYY
jgi:hypothetical protein